MKYEEFCIKVTKSVPSPGIRKGQNFYNLLHDFNPSLANRLNNQAFDPFYNDKHLPDAWKFVYDNWEESPMSWKETEALLEKQEEQEKEHDNMIDSSRN